MQHSDLSDLRGSPAGGSHRSKNDNHSKISGSRFDAGSSVVSTHSDRFDESDDLLSDYTSDTTFFDDDKTTIPTKPEEENWTYACHRVDGKVHILGEWSAKTQSFRYVVIGPDWPCVLMTYVVIIVPSFFVYVYLLHNLVEEVIFFILFGVCIFGLTTVFIADPGLVRKYHHARSRHWTYCDHCESFRPPLTVHCSTCQVCVADYDHHCPWTGKCVGHGNIAYFKMFIVALSWLVVYVLVLAILDAAGIT